MKKGLFWILTCICFLGTCCVVAETAEKEITVMVYMSGSDMESNYGQASAEILEMIHSEYDAEQINLVMMVGGAKNWTLGFDPGMTTIIQGSSGRRGVRQLENYPVMNMGEAETLSLFLRYGVENFPARTYGLILWGHGAGPLGGVCHDELFGHDSLTLRELVSAFSDSPFSGQKLAWIGFDSEWMSTVETATLLSPYAEYMIAPARHEYSGGWDYRFLKGLEADANGAETGKRAIDAYYEALSTMFADRYASTFACVDLSELKNLESCMDHMFRTLAARGNSDFVRFQLASINGRKSLDYDLADLLALCDAFSGTDPEGAALVTKAVKKAVIYSRSDDDASCGLLVFFSDLVSRPDRKTWLEAYQNLGFCPGYTEFISAVRDPWYE